MRTNDLLRRIFDSNKAKHPIHPHTFKERTPQTPISADFLTSPEQTNILDLSCFAKSAAIARGKARCYGWALIETDDAEQNGRTVTHCPLQDDPYHAIIKLNIPHNISTGEVAKAWRHHIRELASLAIFLMND